MQKILRTEFLPWGIALLCVLILGSFLAILANPVGMDDGLRHLMMGRAMALRGIFALPGWSPWFFAGYFHHHPVDPWFLADALYVPFAALPTIPALALFSVVSALFLALAFLLLLRELKVSAFVASLLVALLFFGHSTFSHRLLLGRPFIAFVVLTLLLVLALLRERPLIVAAVLAVMTLFSHLFFCGIAVALVGCGWLWLRRRRRGAFVLLGWSALGVLVGLLLHPLPLEYIRYLWGVFLPMSFSGLPDRGVELFSGFAHGEALYPLLGFAVLFHAVRFPFRGGKKYSVPAPVLLLWLLTFLFLAMFMVWVRAIDFLWPVTLTLLGLLAGDGSAILRFIRSPRLTPLRVRRGAAIFVFLLCALTFGSLALSLARTDSRRSLAAYAAALERVPAGARVFNAEWDAFPPLVAVRPDLSYALGMDPALTLVSDSGALSLLRLAAPRPDLPEARRAIDAREWLMMLADRFPADYVLLSVPRSAPLIEELILKGFVNLSGSPEKWGVFRMR